MRDGGRGDGRLDNRISVVRVGLRVGRLRIYGWCVGLVS